MYRDQIPATWDFLDGSVFWQLTLPEKRGKEEKTRKRWSRGWELLMEEVRGVDSYPWPMGILPRPILHIRVFSLRTSPTRRGPCWQTPRKENTRDVG